MSLAWVYLLIAGVFEIGWQVGYKLSQRPDFLLGGIAIAVSCLAASGYFFWLAQREIPMGTAYAVWAGLGAGGAFMVGILFFGEVLSLLRALSVLLIIAGVVGLKLSHP